MSCQSLLQAGPTGRLACDPPLIEPELAASVADPVVQCQVCRDHGGPWDGHRGFPSRTLWGE